MWYEVCGKRAKGAKKILILCSRLEFSKFYILLPHHLKSMKNPKLATRYAQALYNFSVENGNVETVYQDVLQIQEVMSINKELKTVLESPIISQEKKQNITKEIFQKHLSETTYQFFSLIVKKRREPQLLMICTQFVKIYYKNHHIKEAYITSAEPLSEEMAHYIKAFLEKDTPYTFILHLSVNQKIIGGLVIKIDDFYYDASIQAKINKLKAEFSQNKYAAAF
jgi:F-type H+-transporting ATPase subunit delta